MFKVGNYPKGYNLSLLNTIYHRRSKQPNGKYSKDAIDLIIKDNVSGEIFLETIEEPTYDYFVIKPEYCTNYNQFFIEKEKTDMVSVPFTNLLYDIAQRTNNVNFYMENARNRNMYANTRLHTVPNIMMSDSDIEDHYRWKFSNTYQNDEFTNINKAYFDIEVNTKYAQDDFGKIGECPINCVTIIDDKNVIAHTVILRDKENPLIEEFERNLNQDMYDEFKEFITSTVGEEQSKKNGLNNIKFDITFYDEEIDLIKDVFNYINTLKPEFALAWNISFDIVYLIERIKNLGYKPEDIVCHPDFKYKDVTYYVDERNLNEYAERSDYSRISTYTVYTDQMIHFASRRKGQSALRSFSLDYIGDKTCNVRKYDYKKYAPTLEELIYTNFKIFVLYNIMDTLVQYCIEHKVNDIGVAYYNVLLNNTRISKIYRQTIYLHNRAIKSFWKAGLVMGNNCNKNNEKEKFPGAFVSSPQMNGNYSKLKINGKPVNIFDNLDDFDYKSLYPSITSELNMSPNTIDMHLNIPEKVYKDENRFGREDYKYKREGQFMEDLQSHNWLDFFSRWFHLANYSEMYDDIIEYYKYFKYSVGDLDIHHPDGSIDAFTTTTRADNTMRAFIPANSIKKEKIKIPKFDFSKVDANSFTEFFRNVDKEESIRRGY